MKFSPVALTALFWHSANAGCEQFSDTDASAFPYNPFRCLLDDAIINGDAYTDSNGGYSLDWLPFGVGFEGINGIPGVDVITKDVADAYGGAYIELSCGDVIAAPLTVSSVTNSAGFVVVEGDGFPLQFTWPVITSTIVRDWITVHMSDGTSFTPTGATVTPAADYNEKNNVVLFDSRLLDRSRPSKKEVHAGTGIGAYVDRVEITGPILFAGPDGQVESAEGFIGYPAYDPYEEEDGNRVIRAKMTTCIKEGDEGNWLWGASAPPNSCADVYGDLDDMYRLRLFTQWGAFNPGRMPVLPTDFETLFMLEATLSDGTVITLDKTNSVYDLGVGSLTILGLAETGGNADFDPYDDCYYDDRDNVIDVVIVGDKEAVQLITKVVHDPTIDGYTPFYNPGAIGRDGGGALKYTTASVAHECEVSQNIDDPQQVNYGYKYGQGAYPMTIVIENLQSTLSASDQATVCSVLGGDIQGFTYALAAPTTCIWAGNQVTVYVPALSQCDQEVIMGMSALAEQMVLNNMNANFGGSSFAVDPTAEFTVSMPSRKMQGTDEREMEGTDDIPLTDDQIAKISESTFGPVTCSDGFSLGWVNMTALNLALSITNYLCNVVDFEDACGPTFTICPDTEIVDFTPIVVSQNDVVIECGEGGSGAGGCEMLSSYVGSIAVRDNFMVKGLVEDSDEYADKISGVVIDGLTFTTAPDTFAGVIIAAYANEDASNVVTVKNSRFINSDSGSQSFGVFVADIDFNTGSGVISDVNTMFAQLEVTNCEFSGNTYRSDISYSGTGSLKVLDSYFGDNDVEYNIYHGAGYSFLKDNCFVDNTADAAVHTVEGSSFTFNHADGNTYFDCDGGLVGDVCTPAYEPECAFTGAGGAGDEVEDEDEDEDVDDAPESKKSKKSKKKKNKKSKKSKKGKKSKK